MPIVPFQSMSIVVNGQTFAVNDHCSITVNVCFNQ